MRIQLVLTVVEIALLVIVLAYFLNKVANLLMSISSTLGKIAFGVRAVETQCSNIGPAADIINANLTQAAGGLGEVIARAERKISRR